MRLTLTIQNCFKKAGVIREPISVGENPDDQDGWNFLIERSDIKVNKDIFVTFYDNLKTSDDYFNIFVENDNDK